MVELPPPPQGPTLHRFVRNLHIIEVVPVYIFTSRLGGVLFLPGPSQHLFLSRLLDYDHFDFCEEILSRVFIYIPLKSSDFRHEIICFFSFKPWSDSIQMKCLLDSGPGLELSFKCLAQDISLGRYCFSP